MAVVSSATGSTSVVEQVRLGCNDSVVVVGSFRWVVVVDDLAGVDIIIMDPAEPMQFQDDHAFLCCGINVVSECT